MFDLCSDRPWLHCTELLLLTLNALWKYKANKALGTKLNDTRLSKFLADWRASKVFYKSELIDSESMTFNLIWIFFRTDKCEIFRGKNIQIFTIKSNHYIPTMKLGCFKIFEIWRIDKL